MFGSQGERKLQVAWGTEDRANRFYDRQVQDHLTDKMQVLIRRQEMFFVGTADSKGNCDCSPRFGATGFVEILNARQLAYPEFRGNGVFASLGNIKENPHAGLVFVDFLDTTVGLHVNGTAQIFLPNEAPAELAFKEYRRKNEELLLECWVVIDVDEAYIHCSKHVPRLEKQAKNIFWGTDDPQAKSEDYFQE
ncbi:pyridoxamine 5'-phosphate oxidase family protein [Myxococcota bacterium]|nr:pyridoxamine 5'-phosphate oxidase family protein [Myxococcota bacterium]